MVKTTKIKNTRKFGNKKYTYRGTYTTKARAVANRKAHKNTTGLNSRVVYTKRVLKSGTGRALGRYHVYRQT